MVWPSSSAARSGPSIPPHLRHWPPPIRGGACHKRSKPVSGGNSAPGLCSTAPLGPSLQMHRTPGMAHTRDTLSPATRARSLLAAFRRSSSSSLGLRRPSFAAHRRRSCLTCRSPFVFIRRSLFFALVIPHRRCLSVIPIVRSSSTSSFTRHPPSSHLVVGIAVAMRRASSAMHPHSRKPVPSLSTCRSWFVFAAAYTVFFPRLSLVVRHDQRLPSLFVTAVRCQAVNLPVHPFLHPFGQRLVSPASRTRRTRPSPHSQGRCKT